MILSGRRGRRRRRCRRDGRPGGRNVDGCLELLSVLLLLLLGLLLVVGTRAVTTASAPVEHPPRELTPRHLPNSGEQIDYYRPPTVAILLEGDRDPLREEGWRSSARGNGEDERKGARTLGTSRRMRKRRASERGRLR